MFFPFIAGLMGYLLGAIPFGYLVARAYGVNIFEVGSKNPGATNVKRVLGAKAGNTVFVLDALKGAVAAGWPGLYAFFVLAGSASTAGQAAATAPAADARVWVVPGVLGLIGALLGHSFSCFTGFRGGKGVATAAGGFLILLPVPTLIAGAVWVGSFYAFRYVSLASILAALTLPITAWLFRAGYLLAGIATAVGVFVVVRHHANIVRLMNGTENRFVKKTPPGK